MKTESLITRLEDERDRLNEAIAALRSGRVRGKGGTTTGGRRGPRRLSAAARKKISEAQKKRWAKRKRAA